MDWEAEKVKIAQLVGSIEDVERATRDLARTSGQGFRSADFPFQLSKKLWRTHVCYLLRHCLVNVANEEMDSLPIISIVDLVRLVNKAL